MLKIVPCARARACARFRTYIIFSVDSIQSRHLNLFFLFHFQISSILMRFSIEDSPDQTPKSTLDFIIYVLRCALE